MNKTKVLIVEDNQIIAIDIKKTLQQLEYIVTGIVKKEKDVLNNIKDQAPDIVLMDIDLNQDKNGIEISQEISKIKKIPIIYLSGVVNEAIVDKALTTSPAYYLTKPFNKIQLKTAIELVTIEHSQNLNHLIQLGCKYSFDLKNKKLYHKKKLQKLSYKETQLLELLIEAKGKVVLFETIENIVWENQLVTNDAMRLLISRLRKKINCNLIETIYSHGFKLNKVS